MALNLWNYRNVYESEKDEENDKVSKNYCVSELFCDRYAKYFMQAIKIRYPENFREYQNNKVILLEKQENNDNKSYGAYIRIGHCQNEISGTLKLKEKKEQLLKFCKDNGYNVNRIYCDIGFSGATEKRISLGKLVEEVNSGKLYGIISNSLSSIIRDSFVKTKIFLENIDGEIISMQEGVIKGKNKEVPSLEKKIKEEIDKHYKGEISKRRKKGKEYKKQQRDRR